METFKLNGRTYKARDIDFNFVCILGENDIDINEIGKKVLPSLRVYVAYCMGGTDTNLAGNEINLHILNGGTLEDITSVFVEKVNESAFFQALSKQSGTETTATTTKKGSKKITAEVSE